MSIVYRHYPIASIHLHAVDAALAAECGGAQGRFYELKRAPYSHQDSIGKRVGDGSADVPGVEDTALWAFPSTTLIGRG